MFGYIRPDTGELRVREYGLYRAVYCGLCDSMGRCTSAISRMSLSYDFVFLALVRMALAGESGRVVKKRCIAHPMKKRPVIVGSGQLDICARMSALLGYYKLLDDVSDEKGVKRLAARLLLPVFRGMVKKARKTAGTGFAELEETIKRELQALGRIEKERVYSPDAAAEPFGRLMSAVCSYGFPEGGTEARIAAEIGRHIGRFVYITDAADDFESDLKTGSYNPFGGCEDASEYFDGHREEVANSLTMELVGVSRAVGLLDFSCLPAYGEIIRNIIYLGLPKTIKRVLYGDGGEKKSAVCRDEGAGISNDQDTGAVYSESAAQDTGKESI